MALSYRERTEYILEMARDDGCKVYVYKDKDNFKDSTANFLDGRINIAGAHPDKKYLLWVTAHEYQHYKQWLKDKRRFNSNKLDKELDIEYEAERMTMAFLKRHDMFYGYDEEQCIMNANLYMEMIKWYYSKKCKIWIVDYYNVKSVEVLDRWMSKRELHKPISEHNLIKLDRYYNRYCRGVIS